jgi:hypothetical protein
MYTLYSNPFFFYVLTLKKAAWRAYMVRQMGMPFKLCEKVEHAGGFLLGTWEAAVRAAKPSNSSTSTKPNRSTQREFPL